MLFQPPGLGSIKVLRAMLALLHGCAINAVARGSDDRLIGTWQLSQVESVNEYLFSLHLNADLYTKLTLAQLSLLYETSRSPVQSLVPFGSLCIAFARRNSCGRVLTAAAADVQWGEDGFPSLRGPR